MKDCSEYSWFVVYLYVFCLTLYVSIYLTVYRDGFKIVVISALSPYDYESSLSSCIPLGYMVPLYITKEEWKNTSVSVCRDFKKIATVLFLRLDFVLANLLNLMQLCKHI